MSSGKYKENIEFITQRASICYLKESNLSKEQGARETVVTKQFPEFHLLQSQPNGITIEKEKSPRLGQPTRPNATPWTVKSVTRYLIACTLVHRALIFLRLVHADLHTAECTNDLQCTRHQFIIKLATLFTVQRVGSALGAPPQTPAT